MGNLSVFVNFMFIRFNSRNTFFLISCINSIIYTFSFSFSYDIDFFIVRIVFGLQIHKTKIVQKF